MQFEIFLSRRTCGLPIFIAQIKNAIFEAIYLDNYLLSNKSFQVIFCSLGKCDENNILIFVIKFIYSSTSRTVLCVI